MKTFYLCDLAAKHVLSGGPLPETFGNINCLEGLSEDELADLSVFGSQNLGFVSHARATALGVNLESLAAAQFTAAQLGWLPIEAERSARKSGGFYAAPYWFHSDEPSRAQYNTLLSLALEKGMPNDAVLHTSWKTMTGVKVPLTVGLLRQVRDAGVALESALFECAEAHRTAMKFSPDPLGYDFEDGWPARFGD